MSDNRFGLPRLMSLFASNSFGEKEMPMMEQHRIVYTEQQVITAIERMAREISDFYTDEEVTLVGVLNGGVFFLTALATALERCGTLRACHIDFVRVSSYRGGRTSGALELTGELQESVAGKNVVIVDDVGDTLNTLGALREHLLRELPRTLQIAVLLEKPDKHVRTDVVLDYVGFAQTGLGFVYGCGMDLEGALRGLPFIGEVKE